MPAARKQPGRAHLTIAALRTFLTTEIGKDGRLPPERELSRQLGIGRPMLREHLQALQVVGLLRREQGRGTYLQAPSAELLGPIVDLAMTAYDVPQEDLLVVRRTLEDQAVRAAAGQLTEAAAGCLETLCREMEDAKPPEAGVDADLKFHRLIFVLSGNAALTLFGEALSSALRRTLVSRRKALTKESALVMSQVHRDIITALLSGDPDLSADAMRRHFDTHARLVAADQPPLGSGTEHRI